MLVREVKLDNKINKYVIKMQFNYKGCSPLDVTKYMTNKLRLEEIDTCEQDIFKFTVFSDPCKIVDEELKHLRKVIANCKTACEPLEQAVRGYLTFVDSFNSLKARWKPYDDSRCYPTIAIEAKKAVDYMYEHNKRSRNEVIAILKPGWDGWEFVKFEREC
jgi:hypothetical protein